MKAILFVGGGVEAVPAIARAVVMNLFTVVVDGNSECPGRVLADGFIHANTYDVQDVVEKAVNFHRDIRPINGVICVAADVPVTVATVAQTLGLPGIPLHLAWLSANKLGLKVHLRNEGIVVPWFMPIRSGEHLKSLVNEKPTLLVIKPIDSRGARGVIRLLPGVDVLQAYEESKSYSLIKRVLAEEWIDGPQISTESMVLDGICHTVGIADRNYSRLDKFAPYVIEDGGETPTRLHPEIQDDIRATLQACVDALGLRNGTIKGDLVLNSAIDICVIELAIGRLSGGYFCTHSIPLATGVDFLGCAIRLALGEKVSSEELTKKYDRFVCQRYLFPQPGKVISISNEPVSGLNGCQICDIRVKPGDVIKAYDSHPRRAGTVICVGDTRYEARRRAEALVETINIQTA